MATGKGFGTFDNPTECSVPKRRPAIRRTFSKLLINKDFGCAPRYKGRYKMGAFSLPKPKPRSSGAVIARQVIPADIRDDYKRLYGVAWEERWRAEPGTPAAECKRRYGEWSAKIAG